MTPITKIKREGFKRAPDISRLPAQSGVYVFVSPHAILYVGRSKCLRDRGDAYRTFIKMPNVSLWSFPCEDYIEREKRLIREWNPALNGAIRTPIKKEKRDIYISPAERKALMAAGFPRQTVLNWKNGALPRAGNRYAIKLILGRDITLPIKRKKSHGKVA